MFPPNNDKAFSFSATHSTRKMASSKETHFFQKKKTRSLKMDTTFVLDSAGGNLVGSDREIKKAIKNYSKSGEECPPFSPVTPSSDTTKLDLDGVIRDLEALVSLSTESLSLLLSGSVHEEKAAVSLGKEKQRHSQHAIDFYVKAKAMAERADHAEDASMALNGIIRGVLAKTGDT